MRLIEILRGHRWEREYSGPMTGYFCSGFGCSRCGLKLEFRKSRGGIPGPLGIFIWDQSAAFGYFNLGEEISERRLGCGYRTIMEAIG